MKAIIVTEPGGPEKLALQTIPDLPKPGARQILVDVAATALNRADLLQRRGKYPPPRGESEILGLECSGTVAAVGADVTRLQVGDRIMALLPGGGYAEQVLIHEAMAIPVPDCLSLEEAAAVPEAFLTAREALFSLGGLHAGSSVLIHAAAGGVGSAAVQLAHQAGARVFATAGSDEKLAFVRGLGADFPINYKTDDFAEVIRRENGRAGVDVIVDFVGAVYWEKHASCLALRGRCVEVGVMGGAVASVDFGRLLMKRHQILGLVMRSRELEEKIEVTGRFVAESLPLLADGLLKPIVDSVFPLARAADAHQRMENNENLGKIVLKVRETP